MNDLDLHYNDLSTFLSRTLLVILGFSVHQQVLADGPLQFNRDIRPILSDNCYACHGPDASKREAELRLDAGEDVIRDRGGYRVIAPEHPENSELIARIVSEDHDLIMPPAEHGEPLSSEQIALLRQWIREGATFESHWSFQPLAEVTPPEQKSGANPIDAFIAIRLKEKGYQFSSQAEPRVLLKRMSFDLTGLPPDPADVHAFEKAHTAEDYKKWVEKLLASPHFGERMAMYWLDLVRYADSLGYHGDQERSVSPYRDYVIQAFNENKPFDQFTIEQLAGDLLPNPTLEQKVASTYNRLNRASGEGGVQPKEYLAKYAADRVRTLGTVWLGTTVGCAECHDHKFDPYSIKDFYSFAAFFADIKELGIVSGARHIEQLPVPTTEQKVQQENLKSKLTAAEQAYLKDSPELQVAFENWQIQALEQAEIWETLKPASATSQGGATLNIVEEGTIVVSGKSPDKDVYRIVLPLEKSLSKITALQMEILPDDSLPNKGPGRAGNGNFVVNSINATINGKSVKWSRSFASHSQQGLPAENLAANQKGWAILPQTGQRNHVVLVIENPAQFTAEGESELVVEISQNHGTSHTLGKFRLSVTSSDHLNDKLSFPEASIVALLKSEERNSADSQKKLMAYFREQSPLLKTERDSVNQLRKELTRLEASILTTLATKATNPREMRVLPRGDWMNDKGEIVSPSVPVFLAPAVEKSERLNRLDLANWLVDPQNPLVARTFVNRIWMLFFGQGLSPNVDDLGAQGQSPSHPELLDWLAQEFIESGWDVKHLVKLIVTSQTYRQQSQATPELRKQDPFNRLYARQSRWRLDAEMIRDNALAISGLLDLDVGGPSVKPYQPVGYWAQLNFPKRKYQASNGEAQYRRGVYTHWQRTFLHPSLLAFDAPAREECTARRERSNTPIQALVLLNDPTYVEAARVFAQKILQTELTEENERLDWAWNRALARSISDEEQSVLLAQLHEAQMYYEQHPDAAAQVVKVGLAPVPTGVSPVEIATWMTATRILLNLQETITRY
ncbi:PSD1 and planctomycete cytochrome C domain-containing protein [Rubinisphaera italica]|uniref:Planctomycete cytochrome C n=1 Tax=Rubinisphaera italica TaxID=2527969 RepID=A0A5C5XAS9_9PLAN|nr:PSD1 and planctomycete cytochrome C domain-containing protein [Rubinisphaera italica]TWT60136.1 Planctomycete cytochrome C [Rubinisphaera italica]